MMKERITTKQEIMKIFTVTLWVEVLGEDMAEVLELIMERAEDMLLVMEWGQADFGDGALILQHGFGNNLY